MMVNVNDEFKNWVTVAHAIRFTKEGLEKVVEKKVKTWYAKMSGKIERMCKCSPEVCFYKQGCNTCNKWVEELTKRSHIKNKDCLFWSNSDCKKWQNSGWELIKVYMSELGERKKDIENAESTDLGGILNFLSRSDIVGVSKDIAKEGIDTRNLWAHAANLELTDVQKEHSFRVFKNILEHPAIKDDQNAKDNLENIRSLQLHGIIFIKNAHIIAIEEHASVLRNLVDDLTAKADKASTASMQAEQACEKINQTLEQINDTKNEISHAYKKIKEFRTSYTLDGFQEQAAKLGNLLEDILKRLGMAEQRLKSTEGRLNNVEGRLDNAEIRLDVAEGLKEHDQNPESTAGKHTEPNLYKVPLTQGMCFTGRKNELAKMENVFLNESREGICSILAIYGLGGCGKTSLAGHFAKINKEKFPGGIFWLNGNTGGKLVEYAKSILNLLRINIEGNCLEKLYYHLLGLKQQWIVIINDVKSVEDSGSKLIEEYILVPFVTQHNNGVGNILLTTRLSIEKITKLIGVEEENCQELSLYSMKEGVEFLHKRIESGEENDDCKEMIAWELGCLPLALEQAAAYIIREECTFKEYLEEYRKKKLQVMKNCAAWTFGEDEKCHTSILTTWDMNFKHIKDNYPEAEKLFHVSALLDPDGIPVDIIVQEQSGNDEGRSDEEYREGILKAMTEYSLVRYDKESRTYNVHKMVQEVLRYKLSRDEIENAIIQGMNLLRILVKKSEEIEGRLGNNVIQLLVNTREFLEALENLTNLAFYGDIIRVLPELQGLCTNKINVNRNPEMHSCLVYQYFNILKRLNTFSPVDRLLLCKAQVQELQFTDALYRETSEEIRAIRNEVQAMENNLSKGTQSRSESTSSSEL